MIYYLVTGAGLGLAAGLSPGPLMTLIIAESLRGGWPAGFRVSLAPLITDTVLVTVALLITSNVPAAKLAPISVVGGCIIIWMGWSTIRSAAPVKAEAAAAAPAGSGLAKGIVTNLLNPHAFAFWMAIGVTNLRGAFNTHGLIGPAIFMGGFFAVMIAIDLIIAYSISRGRHLLQGTGYVWTLRLAGLALAGLGAWRLWEGLAELLAA